MCTRRLPALKASRGPCLERFLSGLPPGTAQHGSTAQPGAGVGLPKHGWVLLSPSCPCWGLWMPAWDPGHSSGRCCDAPWGRLGPSGVTLSSAPAGASFGVRPRSSTGFGSPCPVRAVSGAAARASLGAHCGWGDPATPLQLSMAPQVPPSPAQHWRTALLGSPVLLVVPTSGCFPTGTEQSPSPLHNCCQPAGWSQQCPGLQSLPSTHGTTSATGTCISPEEATGVFTNRETQRHPNCQVL